MQTPSLIEHKTKSLLPWAQIAAGSASACLSVLVTNIPEVIKTRLQLDGEGAKRGGSRQYAGFLDALGKIARLEGVRGLQAGLVSALFHQSTMNGARLGLFEPFQRALSDVMPGPISTKIAAGALSGGLGAICGSPFYLVKSRLQAQSPFFKTVESHKYAGLWDGLSQIQRTEGIRGLFRGIDGALPRVMTGSAIQLTSYDLSKAWIADYGIATHGGLAQHTLAGLMSSLVTVTAINPLGACLTLTVIRVVYSCYSSNRRLFHLCLSPQT
jgi:solute carrier family 25 protein 34/35